MSVLAAPMAAPVKVWRIDVDTDEHFWLVCDDPVSDGWTVHMACRITRKTKTEAPTKGFISMHGTPRRNAWQLTPFSDYGYIDVTVAPEHGEPFTAMTGHRV